MNKRSLVITAAVALAMLLVPGAALAKTHHHKARDRNHDGIPDKWEKKHHLSLKVNEARKDPDHDGLNNKQEFKDGTNPRQADTDGDGLNDGQEMEVGDNPREADTDGDGVPDGEEINGTVKSFDQGTDNDPSTGTLTILLPDGTNTVTGAVNSSTRIECNNENGGAHGDLRASDHGGDSSGDGGDRSGSGSSDEGGNETGDENGGEEAGNCTTADLTPGAVVHEAKIEKASDGTPTFTKIELESSSTTAGGTTP